MLRRVPRHGPVPVWMGSVDGCGEDDVNFRNDYVASKGVFIRLILYRLGDTTLPTWFQRHLVTASSFTFLLRTRQTCFRPRNWTNQTDLPSGPVRPVPRAKKSSNGISKANLGSAQKSAMCNRSMHLSLTDILSPTNVPD